MLTNFTRKTFIFYLYTTSSHTSYTDIKTINSITLRGQKTAPLYFRKNFVKTFRVK